MSSGSSTNPVAAFTGRAGTSFNDPFMLPSNTSFPTELETALDFCLYLYYMNPQYRRASIRLVSHFVTDVEFIGDTGSADERDELKDFLSDDLDIWGMMLELGEEWAAYGNGFVRVAMPFHRYLRDPRGKKYYDLDWLIDDGSIVGYDWEKLEYIVRDPAARHLPEKDRKKIHMPFEDRARRDLSRIRFHKLDPRQVILQYSWTGQSAKVVWKFEPELVNAIKESQLHHVNDLPYAMLKAIADNNEFVFNDGQIFHLRAPSISGVSNYGWGIPEILANYRSIHQLQVYRKIDETVGLDYMLPFRLFTPELGGSVGDPSIDLLLGPWKGEIAKMIKTRRQDPFAMHALPFPVNYQEVGANKDLVPKDLMEYQTNDMLDSMGFPSELFKGTLQVPQVPTALRMFENSFHFLYRGFDKFLNWTVEKCMDFMERPRMGVNLERPRMADDLEKRNIYLQLAAGAEIPREVAYGPFGIDNPVEAAKRRAQEDAEIQKTVTEVQQSAEREMMAGSLEGATEAQMAQAGGAPGGGGGSPMQIQEEAMAIAQELIAAQDPAYTRQKLAELEVNPNLQALVKKFMEDMRRQAESEGRASLPGQLQGGA